MMSASSWLNFIILALVSLVFLIYELGRVFGNTRAEPHPKTADVNELACDIHRVLLTHSLGNP
jgi:hypothetical protein